MSGSVDRDDAPPPGEDRATPAGPGRVGLYSAVGAALVAGSLVLLNLLSSQFHCRLDMSANRLYSLSAGSKRILHELPGPVEIRVYFSKQVPPQHAANRSYVGDLLEEYSDASGGRVRTVFVDVDRDEGKREAMENGVTPIEFNVISQEKFEVRQGFMGLVLQHEDRKEVLPVILKAEGLEYDLTSRVLRLTRTKRTAIGIVSSHGAFSPDELPPPLRETLERDYELRALDLEALGPGATVSADIAGLIVLGPSEEIPGEHIYTLDQFLLSGRPVVLAVDTRRSDFRSFMVSSLKTGLPQYLRHHGLNLRHNFVLDHQSQEINIQQRRGWMTFSTLMRFPLIVRSMDLDPEHPVTRYLESLVLPLTSPIEISTDVDAGRLTVLARSSEHSWLHGPWERGAVHSINPLQGFKMNEDDAKGPFNLAVALEGPFGSYFSKSAGPGRAVPSGAPAGHLSAARDGSRLLVLGTSRFARGEISGMDPGALFLMTLVDWLALDDDLLAIRTKGSVFRPLREIGSHYKKAAIRWANILGPALIVAVLGLLRLRRRGALRRARAARYAPDAAKNA